MSPLYDAHNHLQDGWLAPYRPQILAELAAVGVRRAIVNGTNELDWPDVAVLAQTCPLAHPSYGLHPWEYGNRSPAWQEKLSAALAADPRAAVGEIGLDRWMLDRAKPDDARLARRRRAPLEEQLEVFSIQLELAHVFDRPATIHCLSAWGALTDILRTARLPARGFLMHAYSGSAELIRPLADRGAYFSFNGAFLAENHVHRRDIFTKVPLDRLLIETDAPAMPLPAERSKYQLPPAPTGETINHPANLAIVYSGLAEWLMIAREQLAEQVEENFLRLFGTR